MKLIEYGEIKLNKINKWENMIFYSQFYIVSKILYAIIGRATIYIHIHQRYSVSKNKSEIIPQVSYSLKFNTAGYLKWRDTTAF